MSIFSKLKGYKTTIFNTIVAVLGVVKAVKPDADIPDAETAGAIIQNGEALWLTGIAIVNQLLRVFSNTPIFKKHS